MYIDFNDLENLLNDLFGQVPKNNIKFPLPAMWKTTEFDIPVILTGIVGIKDGVKYYSIHGSNTAISEKEISYEKSS